MATYLYKCNHCHSEKEFQHSMKETPQIVCTACLGTAAAPPLQPMVRQIAYKPGVSFRGSGFHSNDDPAARVPR